VLVVLALLVLSTGGCLGIGGCQGESALTAGIKVLNGDMSSLTPGEIQAIAEFAQANIDPSIPTLTDEQAEAIVEFLQINNINSIEDAQNLIDQALTDPSSVQLPDGFAELFLNISPDDLDALAGSLGGLGQPQ
jgi:hypothetical protein